MTEKADFSKTSREQGSVLSWLIVISLGVLVLVASLRFYKLNQRISESRERAGRELVESRRKRAEIDFPRFHDAVRKYREDHNTDPTGWEDLIAESETGPYLKEIPRDPLTNGPYAWEVIDGEPTIVSYGFDGVPGGTGIDADLRSTDD